MMFMFPVPLALVVGRLLFGLLVVATILADVAAMASTDKACERLRADRSDAVVLLEVETEVSGVSKRERVGTGFIISADGWMLTNNHVACHDVTPGGVCPPGVHRKQGLLKARVGHESADPVAVRVVKRDLELDLALLRLPQLPAGQSWKYANLAMSYMPAPGNPVRALGYPRQQALDCDNLGTVQQLNGERGWIVTSNKINPGSSGGPVFNAENRVIGVVHGALEAAAGISFVIPINHARPLLILLGPEWLKD